MKIYENGNGIDFTKLVHAFLAFLRKDKPSQIAIADTQNAQDALYFLLRYEFQVTFPYMRSAMKTYTVRLSDGTVGQINSANAPKAGYEMTITLQDKYGNPVEVTGVVEDVLEEKATSQT